MATVFFDEAGDIPASAQVKLLRVLEQHEVTPVGDTQPRRTSFRVIAATNRDLRQECAERFRSDLFFRLAVFEIHLPPLRQRREEIPQLAELFLRRLATPQQTSCMLQSTVEELSRRDWPGNVRELRNAVEHGALMARGGAIAPEHLPPPTNLGQPAATDLRAQFQETVRHWTQQQLAESGPSDDLYQRFLTAAEPALFDVVLAAAGQNRAMPPRCSASIVPRCARSCAKQSDASLCMRNTSSDMSSRGHVRLNCQASGRSPKPSRPPMPIGAAAENRRTIEGMSNDNRDKKAKSRGRCFRKQPGNTA